MIFMRNITTFDDRSEENSGEEEDSVEIEIHEESESEEIDRAKNDEVNGADGGLVSTGIVCSPEPFETRRRERSFTKESSKPLARPINLRIDRTLHGGKHDAEHAASYMKVGK